MQTIHAPAFYYEPPQEKEPCPVKGCEDGNIYGLDGMGMETVESCPHRSHWSEDQIQAEEGDRQYEEMRDLAGSSR